jgi:enamine deaminase RidA (YjgF/YER057c/UK114 family)
MKPTVILRVSSGAEWEDKVGYCRAVRIGQTIEVSGTTSVRDGKIIGVGDMYTQTKTCFDIIIKAIEEAGGKKEHIVRTRMFLTDLSQWEEAGRVHGEYFKNIKPASTLLKVAGLIHEDMLIEVEATAIIPEV